MIYAIAEVYNERRIGYKFYESSTKDTFILRTNQIIELLKSNVHIFNMKLDAQNKLDVACWCKPFYKIQSGQNIIVDNSRYLCLENSGYAGEYRLFDILTEDSITLGFQPFFNMAEANKILNCYIVTDNMQGERVYTQPISEYTDKGYADKIASLYNKFKAKCMLMSVNISFTYEVHGKDVVYTRYTGTSTNVMIPGFITHIGCFAFFGKYVDTIILNEGLRFLADSAIRLPSVERAEIPSSVKLLGYNAFSKTTKCTFSSKPPVIVEAWLKNNYSIRLESN